MNKARHHATTVTIANLSPSVEAGRYPSYLIAGDTLEVEADIFKDGHDILSAVIKLKPEGVGTTAESPLQLIDNDRWRGSITVKSPGTYEWTIEAWLDTFLTWRHEFKAKLEAEDPGMKLVCEEGALLLEAAANRAKKAKDKESADQLAKAGAAIRNLPPREVSSLALSEELSALMEFWADRSLSTIHAPVRKLVVDRTRARFSAWYEFFPRSATGDTSQHATFRDCLGRLDAAQEMGFDVVYFPPIHPIGSTARKGKNNTTTAQPGDVGSPWAIGAKEGGHRAILPELGNHEDFRWLVNEAKKRGIEIAMDFALNCSPDHPYITEHPEWFFHRPDGTIKYAENPPKKYQDIYNIYFHCDDWQELWDELTDLVRFWVGHGVKIFRVDNPHTKPNAFWASLITQIKAEHHDVLFLAEAFTRPKVMQTLGKLGFSQSYSYFTWRVTKQELTDYCTELTKGEMKDYYIANFWPNTPDILPYHLMGAPPAMFKIRAALAAMLSSSWGMYSGYELCENEELGNGKEEYLDSEKFQLKDRDWNPKSPSNIAPFIGRLNQIRKENAALHYYKNLEFLHVENEQIIAFYKTNPEHDNLVICAISLDPHGKQEAILHMPIEQWGIAPGAEYTVTDQLHGDSYKWKGKTNFISLSPQGRQMHLFTLQA